MTTARIVPGGIADVAGFRAGGGHAGIKIKNLDLALLISERPSASAGVFTTNRVVAAPVVVSRPRARAGRARAVVVNSGCANAATGDRGHADAVRMAELTAKAVGLLPEEVLVASTGVIGQFLPMDRLASGIPAVAHEVQAGKGASFAAAIMTTDLVPKEVLVEAEVGGRTVRIGGAAKGSGMIHPNMATMLGFLATDAAIAPEALQAALEAATAETFNMISVDGDTSTNDCVFALANGEGPALTTSHPDFPAFQAALTLACRDLAVKIAKDGEGATTLIEVRVGGAATVEDARRIARAVVSSNLVKCAVTGRDPNWGRILSAAGASGARFDPSRVDLQLGSAAGRARVVERGAPCETLGKEELKRLLDRDHVLFLLDLHAGAAEATAWGCDLTHAYVDINGSYTT